MGTKRLKGSGGGCYSDCSRGRPSIDTMDGIVRGEGRRVAIDHIPR